MERDFGLISWPRFVDFVNLCFGPPIRAISLGEIKPLYHTGTVEEYQRCFLVLLARCEELTTQQKIDLFTSGLGQPLAHDVELQHPANLQTAMSLARAYEQREVASTSNASAPKPSSCRSSATSNSAASPDSKPEGPWPRFHRLT